MNSITIVDGRISSAHYIFFRDHGSLSDERLLHILQLKDYTKGILTGKLSHRSVHIMRCREWSAIVDDWFYSLYYTPYLQESVITLASEFDVLRLATGDSDDSYEFYYYVNGILKRGFNFVDAWGFKPGKVTMNKGIKFGCEASFNSKIHPINDIFKIADELGIDSRGMTSTIVSYIKPYDPAVPYESAPQSPKESSSFFSKIARMF